MAVVVPQKVAPLNVPGKHKLTAQMRSTGPRTWTRRSRASLSQTVRDQANEVGVASITHHMEQHTLEGLRPECPAGITTHGRLCQLPWLTSWGKDENIGGHDDTSGTN